MQVLDAKLFTSKDLYDILKDTPLGSNNAYLYLTFYDEHDNAIDEYSFNCRSCYKITGNIVKLDLSTDNIRDWHQVFSKIIPVLQQNIGRDDMIRFKNKLT